MWLQEAWLRAKDRAWLKCFTKDGASIMIQKEGLLIQQLDRLTESQFMATKESLIKKRDAALMSNQWEIVREKKKVELKWRYGNSEIIVNFVYLPITAKIYAEWEE